MLNQFIQGIRSELHELFWDAPQKTDLEEGARLEREIELCLSALNRSRAGIRDLRARLQESGERTTWLAARVKVYLQIKDQAIAWRHALELDRVRQVIESCRLQLACQERAYLAQTVHLRQLKQQLAVVDGRVLLRR